MDNLFALPMVVAHIGACLAAVIAPVHVIASATAGSRTLPKARAVVRAADLTSRPKPSWKADTRPVVARATQVTVRSAFLQVATVPVPVLVTLAHTSSLAHAMIETVQWAFRFKAGVALPHRKASTYAGGLVTRAVVVAVIFARCNIAICAFVSWVALANTQITLSVTKAVIEAQLHAAVFACIARIALADAFHVASAMMAAHIFAFGSVAGNTHPARCAPAKTILARAILTAKVA